MIRKIKSKLSVKIFLLTAFLLAGCCGITGGCIVRFAPYVYTHDVSEADELAYECAMILWNAQKEEAAFVLEEMGEILESQTDGEYVFRLFNDAGEELDTADLDVVTGKMLSDFVDIDELGGYPLVLINEGQEQEYTLLATKNTEKESQAVAALKKSLPILYGVVFAVSVIAAFFYTWYVTRPIKRVSALSRRIGKMEVLCPDGGTGQNDGACLSGHVDEGGGLCMDKTGSLRSGKRTDEIGVLEDNLQELSRRLSCTLGQLQEANRKLLADIDRERELERQRLAFFSAASHELKTPVTIIKGQLEGMIYQVGRFKDRDFYLKQSLEVTETLEKMVQELLTVSRLDAPGYTCRRERVSLDALINGRLGALEELFAQRELTLERTVSPDLYVSGDRRLLEKVLDNLLGNAAMYSPAGNAVYVRAWEDAGAVSLSVENTGVFLPEEEIPRLFEAFYRVDASHNRQTGGSGLGLYIVRTILDLHGAQIELGNTGRGVVARVRFAHDSCTEMEDHR